MSKAILTHAAGSIYDDLPESQYHFPNTYLNQIRDAVGDWIVYYEPRRRGANGSAAGRQAYFAVARIAGVRPDRSRAGHSYADIVDYLDFDRSVPFRENDHYYYERSLRKTDGATNRGAFGRSVRSLGDDEFDAILAAGFTKQLEDWERKDVQEEVDPARPTVQQLISRPFRDQVFRRRVREAYANTCAVTRLRLVNGGGRPEVQAAHVRPVAVNGPDTVRNGIALTGTVHWLFDRGLITFDDRYRILVSPRGIPDELHRLFRQGVQIRLPASPDFYPHPAYLHWHREHVFKA